MINIYRPPTSKLETVRVGTSQQRRPAAAVVPRSGPARREVLDRQAACRTADPSSAAAPVAIPVAPRVKPAPQGNSERQFEREQKDLQARLDKEQRALDQIHRQELAQAQAKANAQEVSQAARGRAAGAAGAAPARRAAVADPAADRAPGRAGDRCSRQEGAGVAGGARQARRRRRRRRRTTRSHRDPSDSVQQRAGVDLPAACKRSHPGPRKPAGASWGRPYRPTKHRRPSAARWLCFAGNGRVPVRSYHSGARLGPG